MVDTPAESRQIVITFTCGLDCESRATVDADITNPDKAVRDYLPDGWRWKFNREFDNPSPSGMLLCPQCAA